MTDKERIIMKICTSSAYNSSENRLFSDTGVYWEHIDRKTKLSKGDIVCGVTNPNHDYGISFFEERIYDGLLVKEIGSDKTCNYTNELFMVLRNFSNMEKLCGNEYKTMIKIEKALRHFYMPRLYNVDFEPNKLIITVRKKFSDEKDILELQYKGSLSRITIKSIRELISTKYS